MNAKRFSNRIISALTTCTLACHLTVLTNIIHHAAPSTQAAHQLFRFVHGVLADQPFEFFGGAIFWARRELVERRGWLDDSAFVDAYTLGQLLPGPNVLNLTVIVGHRFRGWTGAAAGVLGFLGWPCLVVVLLFAGAALAGILGLV